MSEELVSVIVPCYNGAIFLEECLVSIISQSYRPLELSFWDDGSSDDSLRILEAKRKDLESAGVGVSVGRGVNRGCGAAKNSAVKQSRGKFLCFLDADDVMARERVARQVQVVKEAGREDVIVGCNVWREPEGSTARYTAWANSLTDSDLMLQRFRECTILMPTWFTCRSVFDSVGGFDESGKGTPEDLIFFYKHLGQGGTLAKVPGPEPLLMYRYHENMTSFGVPSSTIWAHRLKAIQADVLDRLDEFSIWSVGRDGKKFYRSLTSENRAKVQCFLDIDESKIGGAGYYDEMRKVHVPILRFDDPSAVKPLIICVKGALHSGFEENLRGLGLQEGKDYWHFC